MSDNSLTTSTDEQRMLALAKANNQLFGRRQFRSKIATSLSSRPQLRIHPYRQSKTRALSPLIISRSHLNHSSSPTEENYPDIEYVSPPSSPSRSPTPPLWTPPPELSWGSDEDEDQSHNDFAIKNSDFNLFKFNFLTFQILQLIPTSIRLYLNPISKTSKISLLKKFPMKRSRNIPNKILIIHLSMALMI
jgi:hypothetical protein